MMYRVDHLFTIDKRSSSMEKKKEEWLPNLTENNGGE